MRTYSGIALRAPKEQLLTRVDREILGNILQLSRAKQRVSAQRVWDRDAWVPHLQPLGDRVYREGWSLSKDLPRKGLSSMSRSDPCHGFPLPMLHFHCSALQRVQGVLFSLWLQDLVLKMALVESITEVSCAIQAVGVCGSFELSLKQEAMQTLLVSARSRGGHAGEFWAAPSDCWGSACPGLAAEPVPGGSGRAVAYLCLLPTLPLSLWDVQDWIKGEPWDFLVYGVFHVLEELR